MILELDKLSPDSSTHPRQLSCQHLELTQAPPVLDTGSHMLEKVTSLLTFPSLNNIGVEINL